VNKFSVLMDFVGSMEPSKWVSSSGIKAGPYAVLVLCCLVFLRDGMRRGAQSIVGYAIKIAVALTVLSAIF